MGLRPGHCYRSKDDRPYSRYAVRVHRRNYIGAVPGLKIRQFNMGNPNAEYSHIVNLIVEDAVQIRDNALESARIAVNRQLTKLLGKDGFFMKLRIYPYQILRENKQAQGAHADRIQKGMSHPFGRPIGRAIRTRKGLKLMSVLVKAEGIESAKSALMRAAARVPAKLSVLVGTDVKSIGTLPKKVREAQEEVKEATAGEGKEETAGKAEEKGKEAKGEGKETGKPAGKGGKEAEKGGEKGEKPRKEQKK